MSGLILWVSVINGYNLAVTVYLANCSVRCSNVLFNLLVTGTRQLVTQLRSLLPPSPLPLGLIGVGVTFTVR